MNHRELLKRYIKYIEECEGINFIDSGFSGGYSDDEIHFSDEEKEELRALAKEMRDGS